MTSFKKILMLTTLPALLITFAAAPANAAPAGPSIYCLPPTSTRDDLISRLTGDIARIDAYVSEASGYIVDYQTNIALANAQIAQLTPIVAQLNSAQTALYTQIEGAKAQVQALQLQYQAIVMPGMIAPTGTTGAQAVLAQLNAAKAALSAAESASSANLAILTGKLAELQKAKSALKDNTRYRIDTLERLLTASADRNWLLGIIAQVNNSGPNNCYQLANMILTITPGTPINYGPASLGLPPASLVNPAPATPATSFLPGTPSGLIAGGSSAGTLSGILPGMTAGPAGGIATAPVAAPLLPGLPH